MNMNIFEFENIWEYIAMNMNIFVKPTVCFVFCDRVAYIYIYIWL